MLLTLDLSSPEQSVMGKAIEHYHYHENPLHGILNTKGFPHNGGSHTLSVTGNKKDLLSWLDLFLENYPSTSQEINALKEELLIYDKRYIKLFNLKRKDLNGKNNKWFNVSKRIDYFRIYGDYRLTGPLIKLIPNEYLKTVCPKLTIEFLTSL